MAITGFPIVTIQLQEMRQTIAHAFSERQLELTGAVDDALAHAIETFDFNAEVTRVAHEVLRESVKSAVQAAIWGGFSYKQRQDVIVPVVREALRRALVEPESE